MVNASDLRVYEPASAEGFELCQPVDDRDYEVFSSLGGEGRGERWRPIPVRLVRNDSGLILRESDSPWLGAHALVFRARATQTIGAQLQEQCELLELVCKDAELTVLNVLNVIDALDEKASGAIRFGSGRLMGVTKYVFRPEALKGALIFKIPNLRVSPTFVTESFVKTWRQLGLKGLDFQCRWEAC